MQVIRTTLCIFLSIYYTACDFLNSEPRGPDDLIEYVHTTRAYTQTLNRWWPWIAPQPVSGGAAFGELPFSIPSTFPTAASTVADLGPLEIAPSYYFCSETCEIRWERAATEELIGFSAQIFVDSTSWVTSGTVDTESRAFGGWRSLLGHAAAVTKTAISPTSGVNASQLANWAYQGTVTTGSAYFTLRRGMQGLLEKNSHNFAVTADISSLSDTFGWTAQPTRIETAVSDHWRRVVHYSNATSTFVSTRLDSQEFVWYGPGVSSATSAYDAGTWRIVVDFVPEQEIRRLDTKIVRTPPIGPLESIDIVEERITRLGARRTLTASGHIDLSGQLQLKWQEEKFLFGTITIQASELGWEIEAFWDTVFGDLIKLTAVAPFWGIWIGSFSGWSAADVDTPTEQGDFFLLPDGSWRAAVLFKQVDDSLAPVTVIAAPEGANTATMQ